MQGLYRPPADMQGGGGTNAGQLGKKPGHRQPPDRWAPHPTYQKAIGVKFLSRDTAAAAWIGLLKLINLKA